MVFYIGSIKKGSLASPTKGCARGLLEKLNGADIVVGTKRLCKALEQDKLQIVFLADDCDLFIADKVRKLCEEKRVRLERARTMAEIGKACKIDVPAAAAGILK